MMEIEKKIILIDKKIQENDEALNFKDLEILNLLKNLQYQQ